MKKRNKKKNNFVNINVYKIFSITLLVSILFFGVINKNVNGIKKCEKVSVVKKEIINPNVVFFGDSITDYYDLNKYFPNLKKVNSGIAGNRTNDLKNDMYNRVYRYNPSKVILLVGINNFLYDGSSVESVVNDIKDITDNIHKELPNAEILIQSIYPINDDWRLYRHNEVPDEDTLTKKIIDSNSNIKDLCKKNKYTYIDMFKEMADDNCKFKREYTNDGLHPNENGYIKITEILQKYL